MTGGPAGVGAVGAVVLAALVVVALVAAMLVVLHLAALRGRQLLPVQIHRTAGAATTGLLVGLLSLVSASSLLAVVLAVIVIGWLGRWYSREGRVRELGLLVAAGASSWVVLLAWPDALPLGDARSVALAAAMVVLFAGLALAAGGAGRRPIAATHRNVSLDRLRTLDRAVERGQALGPLAAPPTIALMAGLIAAVGADLALREMVETPLRQVLASVAFMAVAIVVWLPALPPRVRDAHETLTWLAAQRAEGWQRRLGRRPVLTPRALVAMADILPDTDALRPLRVESLAAGERFTEARDAISRLPVTFPEDRYERTRLTELVAWLSGERDERPAMRAAIGAIDDPEARLQANVELAAADARRATDVGGDAIGPLAAVRQKLGSRASRYQLGYRTGVALTVLLIGIVASVSVSLTAAISR